MSWDNELPWELGGGSTHIDDIYRALRSAVGVGGAAAEGTLEDLWRQSKAIVIAGALDSVERAALQALPAHAQDHIAAYERNLNITPGGFDDDVTRRQAIVEVWTLRLFANMPEVQRALRVISAQFSLETLSFDVSVYAMFGRMLPPEGEELTEGVPQYPNYSSDFILRVVYTLETGETEIPPRERAAASALLASVLPAWVDFRIYQKTSPAVGLICNGGSVGSVLDYTPLAT